MPLYLKVLDLGLTAYIAKILVLNYSYKSKWLGSCKQLKFSKNFSRQVYWNILNIKLYYFKTNRYCVLHFVCGHLSIILVNNKLLTLIHNITVAQTIIKCL